MHQEAQRLDTELRKQEITLANQVSRHQALEEEQLRRNSFLSRNASHLGYPPLIAESQEDYLTWKKCRAFSSQTMALGELLNASLAQCEQTRKEISNTQGELARFNTIKLDGNSGTTPQTAQCPHSGGFLA